MAGYQYDYSRSNNARMAIDGGIVPLSHFKRATINYWVDEFFGDTPEVAQKLKGYTVAKWKNAAKNHGASEWHHASSWYNEVDHYSIEDVANYILENTDTPIAPAEKPSYLTALDGKAVVVELKVFEGKSRRRMKHVGNVKKVGIVDGDWVILEEKTPTGRRARVRRFSNRVVELSYFDSKQEALKSL